MDHHPRPTLNHVNLTISLLHHTNDDNSGPPSATGPAAGRKRTGKGPLRKGGNGGDEGCVERLHANELAVVLNFLTRREGGPPIPATLMARMLVCACDQRQRPVLQSHHADESCRLGPPQTRTHTHTHTHTHTYTDESYRLGPPQTRTHTHTHTHTYTHD
jgi:hypothetical protein